MALPTWNTAPSIRQLLTRSRARAADTSEQMRDLSQLQSPSQEMATEPVGVVAALSDLALHPAQTFYYSWNWKAALLSAMLRAPVFLFATLRQGPEAISVAVLAEAVYSAAISGCYGAFVQKVRNARPFWASGLLILVFLPGALLGFDYLLHLYTRMPNLRGGMVAAGTLSVLSSLFNWYLMSRDSLLVGKEGHSFASDLKRMPRMVIDFIAWIPRHGYRLMRSSNLHLQA
jgi:hypothetical protein